MGRKQFTFYRSYYDAVVELPKKDQVAVILAICGYALDETEPELTGTAKAVFSLIRPNLDASRRKAESGKCGGNAKQTRSKLEANRKQAGSEKENEIEKENECYKKTHARFHAPSVEEVSAYCREKGYTVDPDHFVAYYTARGWSYGKGVPMKDWQAAVRTWVKNQPAAEPPSPPPPRKQYKTVQIDGEWVDVEVEE